MPRRRAYRGCGIAAALCLCASLVQAGGKPSVIPIASGIEGSRIWMEVSHSDDRANAVPYIEISRETIRRIEAAGETGNRLIAPRTKGEEKAQEDRTGAVDLFERHKSLLIREGPEGVSLGNAFDLAGDIREAVREKRGSREKLEAIVSTLKRASAGRKPVTEEEKPGNRPVYSLAAESGTSPALRVRPRTGVP